MKAQLRFGSSSAPHFQAKLTCQRQPHHSVIGAYILPRCRFVNGNLPLVNVKFRFVRWMRRWGARAGTKSPGTYRRLRVTHAGKRKESCGTNCANSAHHAAGDSFPLVITARRRAPQQPSKLIEGAARHPVHRRFFWGAPAD